MNINTNANHFKGLQKIALAWFMDIERLNLFSNWQKINLILRKVNTSEKQLDLDAPLRSQRTLQRPNNNIWYILKKLDEANVGSESTHK